MEEGGRDRRQCSEGRVGTSNQAFNTHSSILHSIVDLGTDKCTLAIQMGRRNLSYGLLAGLAYFIIHIHPKLKEDII